MQHLDQRRSPTRTHLSSIVAALQMQGRCSASEDTRFPTFYRSTDACRAWKPETHDISWRSHSPPLKDPIASRDPVSWTRSEWWVRCPACPHIQPADGHQRFPIVTSRFSRARLAPLTDKTGRKGQTPR